MYLKKIIASGFKSFADKVAITLARENITGIVGPNGSGKSNVIDAVRWVMGEQNAKMLRGEKATDIIFAGSEKRKPLGMAEVTLVFDNSEASPFCPPEYRHEEEVALTRRLYIDGEREYLINRKPCRLKDILSFFTGTGLGGKSYSMIQQGQVDRILQAKPEEIREILEEAAGISIFKQRRQEALKKLERTQLNLSRIEDILQEVERQMGALKQQVDKAEQWQNLSAELRARELGLFAHNFTHFQRKEQELEKGMEENALQEVACVSEISNFDARYESLKNQLDEADPELHALNEEITVVREKIASSEASLTSLQQLMENGDEQLLALDSDLAEDRESLQTSERQYQEASQRLEKAQDETLSLEEWLASLNDQRDLSEEEALVYEHKVNELVEEKRNLERFLDNNKIRREGLEKEYGKSARLMTEHTEKVLALEEKHSQAQILAEGMSIKLKNSRKGLDLEVEAKSKLERQLEERQEKLGKIKEAYEERRSQHMELKARLASLHELELHSGDTLSKLKILRQQMPSTSELLPLLTDYIAFSSTGGELPTAVKHAFEQWVERLLVFDHSHLEGLLPLIREHKLGPLPACFLDAATPDDKLRSWAQKHSLEPLSAYVSQEKAEPRIASLLNRLYYSPKMQSSWELITSCPPEAVVFCADGFTIFAGADTLLGHGEQQGALSRKAVIAELSFKEEQWGQKLDELRGKIVELEKRVSEDREKINEGDKIIRLKNHDLLELMTALKGAEQSAAHQHELIIAARQEYLKLEEQCERLGGELDELKRNDLALKAEKAQTEQALEDARLEAEELTARRKELQQQCENKRIELASVQSLWQTLREHCERDKLQLDGRRQKLQKRLEEREQLAGKIAASRGQYERLIEDIESFIYQREELEEQLSLRREANAGLMEELRIIERRLQEARSLQVKAQKALSEKELELARVRLGMEGLKQQALEKYNLDLTSLSYEERPNFEPAAESKQIASLRSRLEAMGPINMMAIDEYRELAGRHEFMAKQKNEVVSSVNLLELAIEEVEETSKNKFLTTFTTLNKEFAELFPILFPRGEAHIQLTDETNPLEAGVEIMVRLPGKNRQNMRLFSGGEKALTAIALIFALLKSKPTPFCFLDEVDAPLDETNVGRYNRVLEALSEQFQFIVITHRRRTMEVLDTLYGVTMQEPGVSKVVGVDLSKSLPTHLQKAFSEEPKRQGASTQNL